VVVNLFLIQTTEISVATSRTKLTWSEVK